MIVDLFVGAWEALDEPRRTHWLLAPCLLLLTLMFGLVSLGMDPLAPHWRGRTEI